MNKFIGIDGCKAGWLAIGIRGKSIGYYVGSTIDEIFQHFKEIELALIDIPIGLDEDSRKFDSQCRSILGKRACTVFPVPTLEALNETDYKEANRINREKTGKGISKQAFCLGPKILEVNNFIKKNPKLQLEEFHPEVAFYQLNSKEHLPYPKRKKPGYQARLEICESKFTGSVELFNRILNETKRKDVARDDITDTLIGAILAKEMKRNKNLTVAVNSR